MGAIGLLYVFVLIKMEILAMSLFNRITRNHSTHRVTFYSFKYNSKENVH